MTAEEIKRRAEAGDAMAQYELATLLFYGEDIEEDEKKAVFWLIRAAEQGYEKAIAKLQELNLQ